MSDFSRPPAPWWIDPLFEFAHTGDFATLDMTIFEDGPIHLDEKSMAMMDSLLTKGSSALHSDIAQIVGTLCFKGPTSAVKKRLAEMLGDFQLDDISLQFNAALGELELVHAVIRPSGLEQWAAFCLCTLIEHGFITDDPKTNRLHSCELPSCGKIFVQWNRTDQKTCSKSHGAQLRTYKRVKRHADGK